MRHSAVSYNVDRVVVCWMMIIVGMDARHPQGISTVRFIQMNEQSGFETYRARVGKLKAHVRDEFASDVIKEFGPIVAPYGFTDPDWVYDEEYEMIEILFMDSGRRRAVRIDCTLQDGRFASNYCREEGEWEVCVEGKPKTFTALKKSLGRWLERSCEDCCLNCPTQEEIEEAAAERITH